MNALSLEALYPSTYHADVRPWNPMTQQTIDQFDPALEEELSRRTPDWRVQRGYPGGVSGPTVGMMGCCDRLGQRLAQLSPDTQKEVARRAIEWGVERGIADYFARAQRGMGSLSQRDLENSIARGVHATFGQLIPNLTSGIIDQVTASAKQATSEVIEEKLQKWGIPLAAAVGAVAAVLSVLGMVLVGGYLLKKLG